MEVVLQNSVPQIKTVHMVNVVTQMFVQDLAVCVYHIIIAVIDTIPAKEQVMVSVIPAALENIVSQIVIVVDSRSGNSAEMVFVQKTNVITILIVKSRNIPVARSNF